MENMIIEAIAREELVLSMGLCKNEKKRNIQRGKIEGLKLALNLKYFYN
jgi:hypothetical protein